jgi:hypothetical protein
MNQLPNILTTVLYVGFVLYWLYWFIIAIPAVLGSICLYIYTEKRHVLLIALNIAMVLLLYGVKIAHDFQLGTD